MSLGLAPVAARDRVQVLDVLRGFALLGVLVANVHWFFSGFGDLSEEEVGRLPTVLFDPIVNELEQFFIVNKFITIFSFLFGVGFAIQSRRAAERGAGVERLYVRRMLWLLAIGAAHGVLLWFGDILHLYALLGLLLMAWTAQSDRALIGWGLAFAVIAPVAAYALLWALPLLTGGAIDLAAAFEARQSSAGAQHAAFARDDYADIVRANAADLRAWLTTDDALATGLASFGKFLLGFWAGRSGILVRACAHRTSDDDPSVSLVRRCMAWGFPVGLACEGVLLMDAAFPALDAETWGARVAESALWHAGVLALALSYVCAIVLLCRRPDWGRTLGVFAPVGRMALTNYLGQSVICVFIFYGIGLGWYGRVGPTAALAISIAVFSAQAVASAWWLRRFRYGPAEWAWRSLAYGEWQPFRAAACPRPEH
jgi:uncharacterized protein